MQHTEHAEGIGKAVRTSLVGAQGLGLAGDQDEERVHHGHHCCLDEE